MELGDRFRSGREFINKFLWIICIPIVLNLAQLFSYQLIYKTNYLTITKLFTIKIGIRNFFINGNENWYKFFILHIIEFIPFVFGIVNNKFAFLALINVIFMYVDYSIAIDGGRLKDNFNKGVSFLFNNLGLTIKMAFYYGMIFSLLSIVIYFLGNLETIGIIVDIIIVAYFGAVVNRAVLEVYTFMNKYDIK